MIKIKNLSKKFDHNLVLDKINLDIKSGEIVGFLGPNGAGKTTTMRILTGFLNPTSGSVSINGQDISQRNNSNFKQFIGYLPENNPLYTEMLVFEYLHLMAELKKIAQNKIKAYIYQAVKKTGLEDVYYRPIAELSKGYKQRVGLAVSILGNPKILILDEPTEGLDPNQRIDIRNLVKNLGQDKTVIISSHVLSEIETTCNRIIIIHQGKLVADGQTQQVIADAKGEKELSLEIAGQDIEDKISRLVGRQAIKEIQFNGQTVKLLLSLPVNREIRPLIFNLAKDNHWVIWEMHQKEFSLEDVFKKLTK